MDIFYNKRLESLRAYVPGRPIEDVQREFGLKEVVKLASNENPYGCSKRAKEAIANVLGGINLYPDGNCTELRKALSSRLGVGERQLVFGAGADELIAMSAKVFVDVGGEIVTAEKTFGQYAAYSAAMGGVPVFAAMDNYAYNLENILAKISDRTRVVFIANPNNPTGTAFGREEQKKFLERVPKNVVVVLDEAYAEFADREDFPNSLEDVRKYKNVILMKTFSKAYGLAALRVGYAVMSEELAALYEKVRCPFNVSSLGQAAAVAALGDEDFLRRTVEENRKVREFFVEELKGLGVECLESYTNFVMANFGGNSVEFFNKLMKRGVIVRPGAAFAMEGFQRITLGTLEEMQKLTIILKETI